MGNSLSPCTYHTVILEGSKAVECPKCENLRGFYRIEWGGDLLVCSKCGTNFKGLVTPTAETRKRGEK